MSEIWNYLNFFRDVQPLTRSHTTKKFKQERGTHSEISGRGENHTLYGVERSGGVGVAYGGKGCLGMWDIWDLRSIPKYPFFDVRGTLITQLSHESLLFFKTFHAQTILAT